MAGANTQLDDLLCAARVDEALTAIELPGRMQSLTDDNDWLFDVAHNPAAAAALAAAIGDSSCRAAIVGILGSGETNLAIAGS